MMQRFSNTWSLMKSSFAVLQAEKKLLIFPVISSLVTLFILASFIFPILVLDKGWIEDGIISESTQWYHYLQLFGIYYICYFIMLFFNSATVASAIYVMRGGKPTIGGAVNVVFSRIGALATWALIAASIGLILNIIENQSDKIGKIIAGLLGMSWTLVSFMVLPILIIENKGPVESLKASISMLRSTWGEQVLGHFSFGLIYFIMILPMFVVFLLLMNMGETAIMFAIVFAVIYTLAAAAVQWVLQSIYMGTLYMYARDHEIPAGFSVSQINEAM
ncbi:MAG: hypothetical protein EA364_14385 [Balneolaceae bacterium]|nr:MAG: hypothetical protein EA364_14385 [Balneolaceae bacterium]